MGDITAKELLPLMAFTTSEPTKCSMPLLLSLAETYKLGELANQSTISRATLLLAKTLAMFANSCRISSKVISNLYRSAGSHSYTASVTIVAGLAPKRARISSTHSSNSNFVRLLPSLSAFYFFILYASTTGSLMGRSDSNEDNFFKILRRISSGLARSSSTGLHEQ